MSSTGRHHRKKKRIVIVRKTGSTRPKKSVSSKTGGTPQGSGLGQKRKRGTQRTQRYEGNARKKARKRPSEAQLARMRLRLVDHLAKIDIHVLVTCAKHLATPFEGVSQAQLARDVATSPGARAYLELTVKELLAQYRANLQQGQPLKPGLSKSAVIVAVILQSYQLTAMDEDEDNLIEQSDDELMSDIASDVDSDGEDKDLIEQNDDELMSDVASDVDSDVDDACFKKPAPRVVRKPNKRNTKKHKPDHMSDFGKRLALLQKTFVAERKKNKEELTELKTGMQQTKKENAEKVAKLEQVIEKRGEELTELKTVVRQTKEENTELKQAHEKRGEELTELKTVVRQTKEENAELKQVMENDKKENAEKLKKTNEELTELKQSYKAQREEFGALKLSFGVKYAALEQHVQWDRIYRSRNFILAASYSDVHKLLVDQECLFQMVPPIGSDGIPCLGFSPSSVTVNFGGLVDPKHEMFAPRNGILPADIADGLEPTRLSKRRYKLGDCEGSYPEERLQSFLVAKMAGLNLPHMKYFDTHSKAPCADRKRPDMVLTPNLDTIDNATPLSVAIVWELKSGDRDFEPANIGQLAYYLMIYMRKQMAREYMWGVLSNRKKVLFMKVEWSKAEANFSFHQSSTYDYDSQEAIGSVLLGKMLSCTPAELGWKEPVVVTDEFRCSPTEKLGEGATAITYQANVISDGKTTQCALKVFKENMSGWAETEAAVLARLEELKVPGVARLVGKGETKAGDTYILTAPIGEGLGDQFRAVRAECLEYPSFSQVVDTLECMHKNDFVHRDVSITNLIIHEKTRFVLIDLATAVRISEGPKKFAGTLLFGSDAVILHRVRGEKYAYKPEDDLYSLITVFLALRDPKTFKKFKTAYSKVKWNDFPLPDVIFSEEDELSDDGGKEEIDDKLQRENLVDNKEFKEFFTLVKLFWEGSQFRKNLLKLAKTSDYDGLRAFFDDQQPASSRGVFAEDRPESISPFRC